MMNTATTILLSSLIIIVSSQMCDKVGLCQGRHLNSESMSEKVACWSWCQSVTDCNWFSYDTTISQTCILFSSCPEIEENLQFISGQKDCYYTYSKLLVTTGYNADSYENGLHSEVIYLDDEDIECHELANSIQPLQGATGGLVSGKPMICGGFHENMTLTQRQSSNKCFILGENQTITMAEERSYPSSVSISRDKLWITGGYTSKFSTEIVNETESTIGPTLPYGMYWHCSVHINNTHVILMGGKENGFRPYIFNLNNFDEFFYGPDLSFTRKGCTATQIIHPNGTAFIIIVGPTNTTEILNTEYIFEEWLKGPTLPHNCIDGSMVTSSNGKEVILVSCTENPEKIYKLRWSNETTMEWVLMKQKLKHPRTNAVAMLIPDALTQCNNFHPLGSYLIAGDRETTEVVQLTKTNSTPSFGNLTCERVWAVGAMFGNAPMICGGAQPVFEITSFDSCISYEKTQWSQSHYMKEKRGSPAGVQINSTTFWILGGYFYNYSVDYPGISLDSTEFIIQGQTNGLHGPKLPFGLSQACAVKLSETEIFVIGGWELQSDTLRNEVWIYDPQNGFERNQGPSLKKRRGGHSCSTMKNGEKSLIIVAGGFNALKSVEIYDPNNNTWYSGPSLPYGLVFSAMAQSPDEKGVLLFGGNRRDAEDDQYAEDTILELRAATASWNILDITMKYEREDHVVIPLQ